MLHILHEFAMMSTCTSASEWSSASRAELQQGLLDALYQGDLDTFKQLLAHPAVDPAHKYGKPHFATCLEVACRHPDRADFVRELLTKVKPNINHVVPEPIHYAAGRGNVEALQVLLKDKRTKVNAQDSAGRTALHFVAKNFPEGPDAERYEACIALLMEQLGLDVNRPNFKGFTAVHEAVTSPGGKAAVEALLRYAKRPLHLDAFRGHGRTARDAILSKFPEMQEALTKLHKGSGDENFESHRRMVET